MSINQQKVPVSFKPLAAETSAGSCTYGTLRLSYGSNSAIGTNHTFDEPILNTQQFFSPRAAQLRRLSAFQKETNRRSRRRRRRRLVSPSTQGTHGSPGNPYPKKEQTMPPTDAKRFPPPPPPRKPPGQNIRRLVTTIYTPTAKTS